MSLAQHYRGWWTAEYLVRQPRNRKIRPIGQRVHNGGLRKSAFRVHLIEGLEGIGYMTEGDGFLGEWSCYSRPEWIR